jgi:DNA-binding response OmpR family regulator
MKKIVLIEDDPDLYSLIQYNLEKEGFTLAGSHTGKGALELCRRERPDLIILDIMLPDSDGLDICKGVRAHPELANTPVIFLTARASETDRIVGLELGANDYIVKPFFVRELIARIKIHFRGQKPVSKMLKSGDLELDRARCRVELSGQEISLTATEFRLLEFLSAASSCWTRFGAMTGRSRTVPWTSTFCACGRRSKIKTPHLSSAACADSDTALTPKFRKNERAAR